MSPGEYIGNFINEYKVNIKYKGKNDIEKIELRDTLKYTSTDSDTFKVAGDNLAKNIEKDFLLSSEMKKYSNFEWSNIKDNKNFYEGYGEFFYEIKKYINSNNEYKNNLISFIKHNYFSSFQNLILEFNQNNIYIDSVFKTNFLNVFENKSAKFFENYINSEKNSEKIFKAIFRNDLNSELTKEILKEIYFTSNNMNKWSSELSVLKNEYLKSIKLANQDINLVEKTNEYSNADSIGNIKLKGPTIIIGSGNNKYNHELPEFNLSITYSVSSNLLEKMEYLSEFTSKVLIKSLYNFYGIDSSFKYPEFNSDQDYLMNIGNKQIIDYLLKKLGFIKYPNPNEKASLSVLFWSLWNNIENTKALQLINNLKIITLLKNYFKYSMFIFSNYSNNLDDYNISNSGTRYYNKIDYTFNNQGVSFIPAKDGKKNKNPDSITFKLGYLAVNFKYEKLFTLSENQKSKFFIKFM